MYSHTEFLLYMLAEKKIKIATPASTPHWLYLTTPSGRSIMVDDTVFIRVL